MVTKSKLKIALNAEKGTDFKKLKLKRKQKDAARQQRKGVSGAQVEESSADENEDEIEDVEGSGAEDDDEEEDEQAQIDLDALNDSDTSESSIELEDKIPRKPSTKTAAPVDEEEEDEDEEEDDEDIPMSDLEDLDDGDKEDLIPHQRLTINNTTALLASLKRIALPTDKSVPFATHQTIVASEETAESIPDVSDDLQRELAFYQQSLDAVRIARTRLRAEGVPFSRPKDYFAEMVKEDAHMDKIKAKLVEEATNKKAATEARKMRDLKKFGKQVQVAKLQERQKEKRETLDKIKTLKRKRQESGGGDLGTNEADLFDVGVEQEIGKHNQRSGAGRGQNAGGTNHKRAKKNEKFGFGGKKRHSKSGDAKSSGDLSGFDAKKMKAGSRGKVTKTRPGKARRKSMGTR
ncbi:eukaryotic rRNA processing protein EBP2-domain-containing protein [Dactylonectria macrodidyma]|uniref:Eukaryotic rRNA processing protein EBP2-domain-containing protein n=1 Tax=Dactylonectria macrodidyma TaxID=307937 RepID=A0A9P9FLF1_9HYPO|nr:eukaryotic rRNA processing protein EBP2-domain-containing protein [Dactylonectria macrodidyma]